MDANKLNNTIKDIIAIILVLFLVICSFANIDVNIYFASENTWLYYTELWIFAVCLFVGFIEILSSLITLIICGINKLYELTQR